MAELTVLDRAVGCLVGLACGDALGGPVEFVDRVEIARRYPSGLREFVGGGWLALAPGEITDDTQMTLMVAESLANSPGLNPNLDDLAARFVAWLAGGPKDVGNTTRAAITALAAGTPWSDAGAEVARLAGDRAAGNGAVMRCAPVAIRYRNDRARLIQASIDIARITHDDPRCTWSAVAVNQAIAHLLRGGAASEIAAAAVEGVPEPTVRAAVLTAADREVAAIRAGGFVLDTVAAAVHCFVHGHGFEDTIVAAVALGDDTDTTGAVAGALAGAYYGSDAIPARWRDHVQSGDTLTELARRLVELSERA